MRIASVSFSPLLRDARVHRVAEALSEAGHSVRVVARGPSPKTVAYDAALLPAYGSPSAQRLQLIIWNFPGSLLSQAAADLYWLPSIRRSAFRSALEFKPELVICNDWSALPIGALLKKQTGCHVIYDAHEFALEEHAHDWKWRLIVQANIREIEARYIRDCDHILVVSEGISDALSDEYQLRERPTVLRNVPNYQPGWPDFLSSPTTVLFHGLLRSERGLEELIRALPLWKGDGRLVLRGYGHDEYLGRLRRLAMGLGVGSRLSIEPPESPCALVAAASKAHIGYLALPPVNKHYEYALPNKLFEYLMAGLPILATPRQEIHKVLQNIGAGVFCELDPKDLSDTLNQLSSSELIEKSAAAVRARETLKKLLSLVEGFRPGGLLETNHNAP
jgi:glycogen synthase